jgi:DNA-binding transcriptional LysR family regulator
MSPDLRQMRYFIAVAERRSFTRAAEDMHVAQQALSQAIKVMEQALGVQLLRRTPRQVEPTAAGSVYLAECRRIVAAADRAVERVQAAARGEAGRLRIAYTLTTAYDTIPALVADMKERHPQLRLDAREVFGGDVATLLRDGRSDVALAPMTSYPDTVRQQTVRREPLAVALADEHELARRPHLALSALRAETFEVWPREMAPGFYDAIVGACRAEGFEPELDDTGAGSTVWANIANGRGVGLVVESIGDQLPRGIALIPVAKPRPVLSINAVWLAAHELPAVGRLLEAAGRLGNELGWLALDALLQQEGTA